MDRLSRRTPSVSGGTVGGEARRRRGGPRRTSGEKRQRILDAALRCFVGVGYEHTRIGDICAESGFSVGSVYHFFGSKAEVAADLCADGTQRWAEAVGRTILTAPSAEAAVRGYVTTYFDWVRANADLYSFMNDHRPEVSASAAMPGIEVAHASVDAAVRTRFEAEAAAGRIRRLTIHAYRAILDGPCYAYLLWWSRNRPDMGELSVALAEAVWQALAPAGDDEAEVAPAVRAADGERTLPAALDARLASSGGMRNRILKAALQVFGDVGYDQATIGDIAARSGASVGTIYYHFASKEEIAAHWCREGWRDWANHLVAAMRAAADGRSLVRDLVLANFAWVQANADIYGFLFDARRVVTGPATREAYETMRRAFVAALHESLSAAADRGEVRRLDEAAYTAIAIGMCQGYLVPWTARRDSLAGVPETIADAIWRALRTVPSAARRRPGRDGGPVAGPDETRSMRPAAVASRARLPA